jgi:hypothetical protein
VKKLPNKKPDQKTDRVIKEWQLPTLLRQPTDAVLSANEGFIRQLADRYDKMIVNKKTRSEN